MSLSTYSKNTFLDFVLGAGSFPSPSTVYVSGHTADPALTGANEINDAVETWYVRQPITFQAPASRAIVQTTGNVLLPAKTTAGSLTVTHYGLWDASVNGNFLGSGNPTDQAILQNQQLIINGATMTLNAGGIVTDHAHELLNHIFRNTAMTDAGDVYLALFTADPTDTGSIANEIVASVGYARQLITFAGASGGSASSNTQEDFGPATGAGFGTVTHCAIAKAGTRAVADLMYHMALDASETVSAGLSLRFNSGQVTITL